jgi:hypothetical protein
MVDHKSPNSQSSNGTNSNDKSFNSIDLNTMPAHRTEGGFPPGTILLEDRKSSFSCSLGRNTNHHEGNAPQLELILSPTPTNDPDDPLVRFLNIPLPYNIYILTP